MNELKQSEVVKLITVTLTQILQGIELVDLQLISVELKDNTHVIAKIIVSNTCLPAVTDVVFMLILKLATLEKAITISTDMFLKVLQKKVSAALQMKGKK